MAALRSLTPEPAPPSRGTRLRWKVGTFVGCWISVRLGTWIEGAWL